MTQKSQGPSDHKSDETDYTLFESISEPVTILSQDGSLIYANTRFRTLFSNTESISLDWEHPFFPEYRKKLAQAYLSALNGKDSQCFAMMSSVHGNSLPVELFLFPMYENSPKKATSILVLMRIVSDRVTSFDRSTNTLIEDDTNTESQHFHYTPFPVLRINSESEIIRCSHSLEGFLGCSIDDLTEGKKYTIDSIFNFNADRIKKIAGEIFSGELQFKRIGEVKCTTCREDEKVVNLTLYPIFQNKKIAAIDILIEDITLIKDLKHKLNTMNRAQLINDVSKGFLHSLSNSINVILSKTQMLQQITEKEPVQEGIQTIERSVQDIMEQMRRVQNLLGGAEGSSVITVEPLVKIIEDSVEFTRMQLKVEDHERRRTINIDKKYYADIQVKTDTKLLREIIISMLLKVTASFKKKGSVDIVLKQNTDLSLTITALKEEGGTDLTQMPSLVNVFSGLDIRQVAEKLGLKIFEEESAESYTLKTIFPTRLIMSPDKDEKKELQFRMRDMDILICEDEPALKRILFELFDRMGNRVFICENGKEALEEFKNKHYDLLITDYDIAGITGIELSARVKELNEDIITILLSGWVISDLDSYKSIINLFMAKPFKLDDLLRNISKILKENKK